MDLMKQAATTGRVQATGIGRGGPHKRKSLGLMWVATMENRVLHSTGRCRVPREPMGMFKVPAFTEGGDVFIYREGQEYTAKLCDRCPTDSDLEWQDQAACKGTKADMFTQKPTEQQRIIETYCSKCPVQLECLEHGEAEEAFTGIYGGIYLNRKPPERKEQIEARRKELSS